MAGNDNEGDRLQRMEARIDALGALIKSTLTTLVLRGVLNKADIPALLQESEAAARGSADHAAVEAELRSVKEDMPSYLRAAVGPAPDHDDDDH
jgi:hypothetical protein